ncbi:MAG TPA: TetR/AcrR family transcriptional regulator [Chloroflexia bacterium]|nr:TetR/AcrR family transcriptional regulator [Chloroflexia bacterium]
MSPRPDVSEERVRQILEAAGAVFARSGFSDTRMDDIATAAGLSKGALYLYFPGKEGIIMALLRHTFDRELEGIEAALGGEGTVVERLVEYVRTQCRETAHLRDLLPVTFEFYATALRNGELRSFFHEYFARSTGLLSRLLQQGIDRGELRPHDTHAVATLLTAQFEGLALLWLLDPDAIDRASVHEQGLRATFEGLKA